MTRRAAVHRLSTRSPDDVDGLERAFAEGRVAPAAVVAVFGKTEGNGLVNDWSRGLAARALHDALARHVGLSRIALGNPRHPASLHLKIEQGSVGLPTQPCLAADDVCFIMSGGTEGGLSPHVTVFEVREDEARAEPGALAIGRARTPDLLPEHLGRLPQVRSVAAGVEAAMRDAGIEDPGDVHFVQVKCPLLTSARIAEARRRGAGCATPDTLKSMGLSRAASALGIASALGEIGPVAEDAIGRDLSLFSTRASASAGVELLGHEIVVLGRGHDWSGPLRIDHATMTDGLDVEPVRAALARLGLGHPGQLAPSQRRRLVAMLAKAEAPSDGTLRGFRHTMLTDSDLAATRHARAFTGGVLAGLVGHAELYVSGGAEHQGPDGGGPVAIIAEAE